MGRRLTGARLGIVTVLLLVSMVASASPFALSTAAAIGQRAVVNAPRESAPQVASPSMPSVPRLEGPGPQAATRTGPLGTYYFQEGAEFLQVAGSSSNYFTHLSETFVLPAASVSTGFELNGVTSTGDWIQMSIGDDWPYPNACLIPTYTLAFELWDSSKNSQSLGSDWWENGYCSQAFTPHLGDTIALAMSLNCPAGGSGSVCLTYTDVTQGVGAVNIQPQPDYSEHGTVATYFVNGGSPLVTTYGYFVGPATESIILLSDGCPTYNEPTVSYVMTSSDNLPITQYRAWSDEFEYFSNFECVSPSATDLFTSASPTTTYSTESGASTFGVHIVAGQNWTAAEALLGGSTPVFEFRFETDPVPLSFRFTVNPSTLDAYQNFEVDSSAGSSDLCFWSITGAGSPYPIHASTRFCRWDDYAPSHEADAVVGILADPQGNMVQSTDPLVVYAEPTVQLNASHPSVLEYHAETFETTVELTTGDHITGYTWGGLPRGCRGPTTRGEFTCMPTALGTFNVTVAVTDSNGDIRGNNTTVVVTNPCATPGSCFTVSFTGPATQPWRALLLETCKLCTLGSRIFPSVGSKAGSVSFLVPNGTYQYLLSGASGARVLKLAPFGNLTVNGVNLTTSVEIGKGSTPALKFSAGGLPKGVPWCLSIVWTICSSNRTIVARNLTPGVYPYLLSSPSGFTLHASEGGSPIALSGSIDLPGKPAHVTLKFQAVTEPATFGEVGLPNGTTWCLEVQGQKKACSAKPTISLSEPNGTYLYSWVTKQKGFEGGSGSFEVDGASSNATLLFDAPRNVPATVALHEPSLPVTLGGLSPGLAQAEALVIAGVVAVVLITAWVALRPRAPRGR